MIEAISASVAVVVVAGIVAGLGIALRNAWQVVADARVLEERKAGELAIAKAEIATWKITAAEEKRRADALDDVLDEVATSGDAAGARSRVLGRWARTEASTADATDAATGSSGVPTPSATVAARLDEIATPG